VLAFAHVVELFADEFAGLGGGGLTLTRFSPRAFDGALFRHDFSFG
jgi:hypothetical protein